MEEKLIRNEQEAIETIQSNMPTSGYYMLRESLDMAISALEKQIPKKPVQGEPYDWIDIVRERGRYVNIKKRAYHSACPCCGNTVLKGTSYCRKCGQAICWE